MDGPAHTTRAMNNETQTRNKQRQTTKTKTQKQANTTKRTPNIDVFDARVKIGAFFHGFRERVQVDHHQVDLADVVLLQLRFVCRITTHSQQSSVFRG